MKGLVELLRNLLLKTWLSSNKKKTISDNFLKFPHVVEGIFNSIDAISLEAVKILNRPSGTPRKSCSEDEHQTLQVKNNVWKCNKVNQSTVGRFEKLRFWKAC